MNEREGCRSQHFCPEMQLLGKKNKHRVKKKFFFKYLNWQMRICDKKQWVRSGKREAAASQNTHH